MVKWSPFALYTGFQRVNGDAGSKIASCYLIMSRLMHHYDSFNNQMEVLPSNHIT